MILAQFANIIRVLMFFLWHFKPISLREIVSQKIMPAQKIYLLEGLGDVP